MKRIKQMLMGIFLAVIGMPLLIAGLFANATLFAGIGFIIAVLGLGFAVVGYILDEND